MCILFRKVEEGLLKSGGGFTGLMAGRVEGEYTDIDDGAGRLALNPGSTDYHCATLDKLLDPPVPWFYQLENGA